jgi:tRNA-specific 2-thiouridylase
MGADFVATGHYVKIKKIAKVAKATKMVRAARFNNSSARFALFTADDPNKDQSYFLWTLTQKQLAHCIFPIGDYEKPKVREMARRAGLPTAEKKDSQGICFLGQVSIEDFLKQYIPERRGEILTTAGTKIGEHRGAQFYTIGQRHIDADFNFPKTRDRAAGGGDKPAERKPLYVASKNAETNTVVVAEGSDDPALYRKEIELVNTNFISGKEFVGPVRARVRYRQPLSAAILSKNENGNYLLSFASPQKFVAEGQSAVFYSQSGEMLGGSIII